MKFKRKKMENLINDDLELSSFDESDNEFNNDLIINLIMMNLIINLIMNLTMMMLKTVF